MEKKKDIGYIVPHTHWDREWRSPLWESLMHLVKFMDELLTVLDTDPEYKNFLLDGQSVIVQDYLEVRPERREELTRRIREGRISVGPWYTLPDLYPLDGESLVRNLLKGTRYAESLGGCLKIGYNSFGWGQTAQFPQIYAGFGIDTIVTAKHITAVHAPESEFLWEAPDGTRALATRLGRDNRHNFFMNAYIPIVQGLDYASEAFRYTWGRDEIVHRAGPEGLDHEYLAEGGRSALHTEFVRGGIQKAWDYCGDTTLPSDRLIMNGCDFTTPQPEMSEILRLANDAFDDKELVSASLDDYFTVLREKIDIDRLRVIRGELRDGPAYRCSANALATRPRLKRLNRTVQDELFRRAEPLSVLASLTGIPYEKQFLSIAFEYMLKAHPHDSINGVTRDKTANDTECRLEQALEIARTVTDKACRDILRQLDLSVFAPEDVLVAVFNPSLHNCSDVVAVTADLPEEYNIWDFDVLDASGHPVEKQFISRQEVNVPVHRMDSRPLPFRADRYRFYLRVEDVPALGYKVFRVAPKEGFDRSVLFTPEPRMSDGKELSQAANCLENAFLRAAVEADGTLTLTDKVNGHIYTRLNYLEDTGDCGDYWSYYPPYRNKTLVGAGHPKIWLEDNGPLSATVGVSYTFPVPAFAHRPEAAIRGDSRRDDSETDLAVMLRYTLKKDSKYLECELIVDNTARDHRLRLLLDTGVKTEYADAAGHFTVDRRPAEPPRNAEGLFYPEMRTLPLQQFVDVSDGQRGLAVIGGFTEYELLPGDTGALAMTVFRSVRNIICTEYRSAGEHPNEDGGQSLGVHKVRFALCPHTGSWSDAGIYREADKLLTELPIYQLSAHGGTLPSESSFLSIEPSGLVVSALKRAEDRNTIILRLFNPSGETLSGAVHCAQLVREAWINNLNEERQQPLPVTDGMSVPVTAAPNKIVTFELVF